MKKERRKKTSFTATIPAYSTATEDEEVQADLIEKLYSVWFSHKNVEQVVYWNLVDGYAAFAPRST